MSSAVKTADPAPALPDGFSLRDELARSYNPVNAHERMLVTKVSGNNTWTVTRHTGGTTADPAGYDQGDFVMTTPLPPPCPSGPFQVRRVTRRLPTDGISRSATRVMTRE